MSEEWKEFLSKAAAMLAVVAFVGFFMWLTYKPITIDGRKCFTMGVIASQVHCW